ncbi:heterokaryon incompatibility protein-domain-containing protein [Xylaria digitata]|nr:heterokaryon incompatibility protein-domain-containing protein [Xylaria digitata]
MPTPTHHWHDPKCPGPRIEFEHHEPNCETKDTCHLLPQCKIVPHCVACERKPPLHDIISEPRNFSTTGAEPQDKAFGQLNLYWPSRDLYHGSADLMTSKQATCEEALSKVYPTTLLPNQFRQACLSPTGGVNFHHAQSIAIDEEDFPVHLTLEVYEVDNCPEYEAFSYTWEGEHPEKEEGSLLCGPVYIGPSWDILIQTRNCWELLRFARLPHTARRIWVDAVCINQDNMEERAQQIANMGRVYGDSLRVVVYLGPDVVVKPKHRFPRRHHFDQFAGGGVRPVNSYGSIMDLDTEKLFRRRYFTRLWVIQELIAASKVIIRIGDIDVAADSIITKRLKNTPGWDWAKTSAPWFQYVTQQALGTDPCDALQLVSNANCADLRDRLFGILWLMNPEDTTNLGVQANYSLSSQHVWIGFFAHCLLRLNISWVLIHAVGPRKSPQSQPIEPWIPSWVPDWTSRLTWQRFHRPALSCEEMADKIRHALMAEEPYTDSRPLLRDKLTVTRLVHMAGAESRTPWNQGATVDSKTGTLSRIRAIRLFAIPSIPQLRTHLGDYGVYEVDLRSMHWRTRQPDGDVKRRKERLYLVSQQPLNRDILPMHDHLYVLYTKQGLQFLILRDFEGPLLFIGSRPGPRYFKMAGHQNFCLAAAVPYIFLGFSPEKDRLRSRLRGPDELCVEQLYIEKLPRLQTVCQLVGKIGYLFKGKLASDYEYFRKLVNTLDQNLFGVDDSRYEGLFDLDQIFPGRKKSDLLPVYWELANEVLFPEARSDERLKESYIASVGQGLQPVILDGYVELQFVADRWDYFKRHYRDRNPSTFGTGYRLLDWQWSYRRLEWSRFTESKPMLSGLSRSQDAIHIRVPLSQILSTIRQDVHTNNMAKCIIWLRSVLDTDDLEELQEQLTNTQKKFRNLKIEQRGFAVDGDVHTINIY